MTWAWNEVCSDSVTNFLIEVGRQDGGPYPDIFDAGFSCDGSLCQAGGPDAQRSCGYSLRGLEAGSWCAVAESCNTYGCSVPSGQVCFTVPPACP